MGEVTGYRLRGVNKLDARELRGIEGFTLSEEQAAPGAHGEPVTIIAMVAPVAIAALAAYFLKKNKTEEWEEEIEEVRADGTVHRRRVHYKRESSEAPESKVVSAIRGEG